MKDSPEAVSPDAYTLHARLNGHQDAIYCLAVSPNGRLLASGGRLILSISFLRYSYIVRQGGDGVYVWDLQAKKLIGTLQQNHAVRGPTTCVIWLTRGETPEIVCQGTGLGYISVWRRSLGDVSRIDLTCPRRLTGTQNLFTETHTRRLLKGGEIVCMASDLAQDTRIAVGTRCRIVHVFKLDTNMEFQSVFSVSLELTVPITLGFADNNAKDVIVFGLFNGQV